MGFHFKNFNTLNIFFKIKVNFLSQNPNKLIGLKNLRVGKKAKYMYLITTTKISVLFSKFNIFKL